MPFFPSRIYLLYALLLRSAQGFYPCIRWLNAEAEKQKDEYMLLGGGIKINIVCSTWAKHRFGLSSF